MLVRLLNRYSYQIFQTQQSYNNLERIANYRRVKLLGAGVKYCVIKIT